MSFTIPEFSITIPWWLIIGWVVTGLFLAALTWLAYPWNVSDGRDASAYGVFANLRYGFTKTPALQRPVFVLLWILLWPGLTPEMWSKWKRIRIKKSKENTR